MEIEEVWDLLEIFSCQLVHRSQFNRHVKPCVYVCVGVGVGAFGLEVVHVALPTGPY